MRQDSKGLPDICRESYSPIKESAKDHIKYVKLATNGLIDHCRKMIDANQEPEVKRLFAMAASAFEEGSMWAVKGMTSEDWNP